MFKTAINDIKDKLGVDSKRINHILGVFETSLKLADHYHVNRFETGISALYHDYHKNESLAFFEKYLGTKIFKQYEDYQVIYHALAAQKTLKIKYPNLNNDSYLAVKNHIFGGINMSMIEKIVFVSDYCEPSRKFIDTNYIYNLALTNINEAVLYCIKLTIDDLTRRKLKIHPDQFKIYEYYLKEVKKK